MDGSWAWAAGLFEGEGSIVVRERQVHLWLRTTDLDVLERFVEIVDAGNITTCKMRPCHTKQQYSWCISRREDVARILNAFSPWLGERRRAKAAEALGWIATKEGNPPFLTVALTALVC
jgi:hypothetical protein